MHVVTWSTANKLDCRATLLRKLQWDGGKPSLRAMEENVLEETFDSLIESLAHHGPVLARIKVNYPITRTLVTFSVLASAFTNVFEERFVLHTRLAQRQSVLHRTSLLYTVPYLHLWGTLQGVEQHSCLWYSSHCQALCSLWLNGC